MKAYATRQQALSPMSYFLHSLVPLILGAFVCSIQQAHGAWSDGSDKGLGSKPQSQGWRKVGDVTMEDLISAHQGVEQDASI